MTTASGISVNITRVMTVQPYGFFVQWEVRRPVASGVYRFWLARSGGPEGPWENVAEDLHDKFCFVDRFDRPEDLASGVRRPNQLAIFRQFYYRVQVLCPNGERDEAIIDGDPPIDRKSAQHWRRALKNFQDTVRLTGRPCVVLKRRRWGKRCPRCSDAVLKEPLKSSCTICWGTGFEGGFWNPILMRAHRAGAGDEQVNTPSGRSDTKVVTIKMQSFPDVERDDVFVFLTDRKRFLVERVSIPEVMGNGTHQSISATEINSGHILHRFRVEDDVAAPLV